MSVLLHLMLWLSQEKKHGISRCIKKNCPVTVCPLESSLVLILVHILVLLKRNLIICPILIDF